MFLSKVLNYSDANKHASKREIALLLTMSECAALDVFNTVASEEDKEDNYEAVASMATSKHQGNAQHLKNGNI